MNYKFKIKPVNQNLRVQFTTKSNDQALSRQYILLTPDA